MSLNIYFYVLIEAFTIREIVLKMQSCSEIICWMLFVNYTVVLSLSSVCKYQHIFCRYFR